MDKDVIEFLNREDVQDALANNDLEEVYRLANFELSQKTGKLTRVLIEADVNPLQGMTEIPEFFLGNQKGIKEFNIPDRIVKIGYSAFELTGLESIYIPDSVKEISSWTFNETKSLKEVRLPRGIVLGHRCFAESGLESIELKDAWFSIGDVEQFNNCRNLKSAAVRGNITYLPAGLFESCSSLAHVELPVALKEIKSGVFDNSAELKEVHFAGTAKQWKRIIMAEDNAGLFNCKIICSDGVLKFDKTTEKWVST